MLWGQIRQVDIQGRSLKRRSSKRSRREQVQAKTRRYVVRREDEAINTAKHVWKSYEPEIRWTSASWNKKTQTTCSCTLEGARPTHNLRSLSSQEETNKKSKKCWNFNLLGKARCLQMTCGKHGHAKGSCQMMCPDRERLEVEMLRQVSRRSDKSGKFRKVKIGSDEVQRGQDQTSRKLKFWLSKWRLIIKTKSIKTYGPILGFLNAT